MRIGHYQVGGALGIAGINLQEYLLHPAVSKMLVDQMTLSENLHFQVNPVRELGTVGAEFQEIVGMRTDVVNLTPDPPIAVLASLQSQEPAGMICHLAEIH